MITRMVSLNTYRQMQNEKVEKLDQLKIVSAKLKSDLESQQAQLQADAKAYDEEYTQLESKLSSLGRRLQRVKHKFLIYLVQKLQKKNVKQMLRHEKS
jgi:predicted nuclease with TOPRIM domain